MPLPSPSTGNPFALVERVADQYRTVQVEFYDPEQSTIVTPYDPDTGLGGEATHVVLWTCRARITPVTSRDASTAVQWGTKSTFEVDIALAPTTPRFRPGTMMRALSGGNDPQLVGPDYQVLEAIDSSLTSMRRVTVAADLAS